MPDTSVQPKTLKDYQALKGRVQNGIKPCQALGLRAKGYFFKEGPSYYGVEYSRITSGPDCGEKC